MAKQSFAEAAEAAPEETKSAQTEQAAESSSSSTSKSSTSSSPAVREERAPAVPTSADGQLEGAFDRKDLQLPRINLAQKSGKIGDNFAPGSFVLAKSVLLSDGKAPFNVVVLSMKKQYQEDLPFDEDNMPNTVDTPEQVREAGGSLKYGDDHYYKPMATALVMVEAPAGLSEDKLEEHFPYECDGKRYALGLWTFGGTSYTAVAKKLFTARQLGHLKEGFEKGVWAVTSEKKTGQSFSWFQPVVVNAGKTSDALQATAKEMLG